MSRPPSQAPLPDPGNKVGGVSIKRRYIVKSKQLLLLEQNAKEMKEDLSIVELNISNLYKAVIPWTKSTEALKNCSSIY